MEDGRVRPWQSRMWRNPYNPNKISISNKILGIGENQPSTSSTTRAENEMGTSSQLPSTAKSSQPQVPNSLPKIIVKNCTNCKVDVHIGKN
jgi:hypothetical protein